MRMKKNIEAICLDGAAPVEDLYGLVIIVALDDHFGAEGVLFICGHECVTGLDIVAGSCLAV